MVTAKKDGGMHDDDENGKRSALAGLVDHWAGHHGDPPEDMKEAGCRGH